MKPGKVYIVGAGPGDEQLITLRAIELLKQADVVCYDRLANQYFLELTSPQAELIYVGKQGGKNKTTQDEIHQILLKYTSQGKSVVRLKGGDPFIFGRGGEEAAFLKKHLIEYEMIPGITSAQAVCLAGIPLSHRHTSSTITFMTGHEDPNKQATIHYPSLVALGGTLVIYMGLLNIEAVTEQLLSAGMNPQMPVAIVQKVSLPDQKIMVTVLHKMLEEIKTAKVASPALIIVGEVVKLQKELSWFEQRPLYGKKILVTRTRSNNSILLNRLYTLGAHCVELPCLKIMAPSSWESLDQAIFRLQSGHIKYDWILFSSSNGIDYFFERSAMHQFDSRVLAGSKIAAIGASTMEHLRQYHLVADLIPEQYGSQSLAHCLLKQTMPNKRVLLIRAEKGREELVDILQAQGIQVDIAMAYQSSVPEGAGQRMQEIFLDFNPDLITFASSQTVENFCLLAKNNNLLKRIQSIPCMAIGPTTLSNCQKWQLQTLPLPKVATLDAMVDDIINYFVNVD